LSAWLKTEANKPRKQKRTIKQLDTSKNLLKSAAI
jgi:hypothetical protein